MPEVQTSTKEPKRRVQALPFNGPIPRKEHSGVAVSVEMEKRITKASL